MSKGPKKLRPPVPLPAEGFAGIDAVCTAFGGAGRSTVHHWVATGQLPRPVRFSPNRSGWPVEVIRAEIEKRKAGQWPRQD